MFPLETRCRVRFFAGAASPGLLQGAIMIVVTAPTGQIGQKVLASLLDGDQPVRVIVRDPARLTPQARERAEVVTGSHGDPGVLTAAFTGADAVLWLVPPNPGADNIHDHYLDFTRPACEAFTAQGVRGRRHARHRGSRRRPSDRRHLEWAGRHARDR
jgi:uncharacterized protein YbjT (DUF2867 family)